MKKNNNKSMQGATLLEIMLVLAIAAMIIVSSIRYYQSTTNSEQANNAVSEVLTIIAAADSLAIGPQTYKDVTTEAVTAIVGAKNMKTPTQGDILIVDGTANATGYKLDVPLSDSICPSVAAQLESNKKITKTRCTSGSLTFTYNNSVSSS